MHKIFKDNLAKEISRIDNDAVLVSVVLLSTTYDSWIAWGYDYSEDIAEYIRIEDVKNITEEWFKSFDNSRLDYSDPERIEEGDWAYGHKIRIYSHFIEGCERQLEEYKYQLKKIQRSIDSLSKVVQA